jgi:tripartite ATP-independent transporter DctP family solute receptor
LALALLLAFGYDGPGMESADLTPGTRSLLERRTFMAVIAGGLLAAPLAAEAQQASSYKPEFQMSVNVSEETSWGKAAIRFADLLRYRTGGRILIKNHFDGRLFAGRQTTEFQLLQQGTADFALGSTINWSPQVKELNLFALPFLFPNYGTLDAVQSGEPGTNLFKLIEQKGVVPIAWGENGFRELTNSKHPVRRPEDLQGLRVRVVGIPIFADTFRALGANPVSMNWNEGGLSAILQGTVDGQENPIGLIIPYRLWSVHKYVTLWHYAVDPLILAISAKTWMSLSPPDRNVVRKVGEEVMVAQKREVREGLESVTIMREPLQNIYGMEVIDLSPTALKAFRDKTRPVFDKWTNEVGSGLVRNAEKIVDFSSR